MRKQLTLTLFLLFFATTSNCSWQDELKNDLNEFRTAASEAANSALERLGRATCVTPNQTDEEYDEIPEARGPEGNNSDGNNSPNFLDRLKRLFDDPPPEAATNCNESDLAQESEFVMISKEEHPEVEEKQQLHSVWWW